jgi:hypothetical protein
MSDDAEATTVWWHARRAPSWSNPVVNGAGASGSFVLLGDAVAVRGGMASTTAVIGRRPPPVPEVHRATHIMRT